ncbi:MAG TPA: NAD(P)/FAD-dependent oxidoreductase [Pirellulales bacterium]|jgi:flavin-dependent dehydrogenase|nr:NAD(P)/FAD-dependent oxidoreductase [Pirellulales bacterium]
MLDRPDDFDALVIGGGPAGATTALLLARAGWSVAVIESKSFPRRKVCGEYLSATNWPLFEKLGLAAAFDHRAGPEIRRVGLLAGRAFVSAELPLPKPGPAGRWGRALSREKLDTLLLEQAAARGAEVLQPWRAVELRDEGAGFACLAEGQASGEARRLRSSIVVAAHGSWTSGPLPTQDVRPSKRAGDLFGFKASFRGAALADDLMPLVSFAGGYGGLVRCDDGRTSLSCCIRRDRLAPLDRSSGDTAGEAVLAYLLAECPALRAVLGQAVCDLPWLSAGPIRPGIRPAYRRGVFQAGNAAGEAHPVVAEGITMAMQSAWLLAERLIAAKGAIDSPGARDRVGRDYAQAWRRAFAPRIHAAASIAQWAMRPAAVQASLPVIRRCPRVLTWGARCSGKISSPMR